MACAGYVQSAIALIPASDPLSALDKRHSAKPRPGLDVILPQLASLASQYGLNSQLVSTDALQSQASEISELADLSSKIVLLEKAIDDRRFQLSSTLWTGVTSMYSMFKRLSKDNPQLAAQLVPVAQYFTRRNAAVKANHPKSARGKAALAAKQAAVKGASSSSSSANGQAVPSAIPAMVPSVTLANGASATRTTQ